MLVKMREQETNCRRFDNTPGTRKHRATELFNERHGLSALFCSGFLARCRPHGTNPPRSRAAIDKGPLFRKMPFRCGAGRKNYGRARKPGSLESGCKSLFSVFAYNGARSGQHRSELLGLLWLCKPLHKS